MAAPRASCRIRRLPVDYLTRTLNEQRVHVESAIDDLVVDGLAERDGDRVRASAAAWRFDALWPVRP
jgi:hypothetical protein